MLKINNTKSNKGRTPLLLLLIAVSGTFLFQYLTFIPQYSHAKTIETPVLGNDPVPKTLEDISYMSELTPEICGNTKTPDAFLANDTTINSNVPTKQLIDDREGVNGTKYWVSKLADGNCWMTQNMAYTGDRIDQSGNFNKTKIGTILAPGDVNNPISYSEVSITDKVPSNDPNMAVSVDNISYNAHYGFGVYYNKDQAVSACSTLGDSWALPTSPSAASASAIDGSYSKLLGVYKISNNAAGSLSLRKPPFYFIYGGNYDSGFYNVGTLGFYWTPTLRTGTLYFLLLIGNTTADPRDYRGSIDGFPARCVVQGLDEVTPPEPEILVPNPTATITIPPILTLSVSDSVNIDTKANDISEGNFTTTISSNNHYTISLSTIPNGHTDLQNDTNPTGPSIPALSTTAPIITETDDSWWGIKCTDATPSSSTQTCHHPNYTGLTTTPATYFTSTTGTVSHDTIFNIGIKTSPSLPSGTYSTSIQVTASQK